MSMDKRDRDEMNIQNQANWQNQAKISTGQVSRKTARDQMIDMVMRMRVQANSLEKLARSIPEQIDPEADEALWRLIQNVRQP